MDGRTPRFKCALKLPDSLVMHVVGHQGRGLKQALDISGACLSAFSTGLRDGNCHYITIQGTDQQIGEALVVFGKHIAKQCVHVPYKQCATKCPPLNLLPNTHNPLLPLDCLLWVFWTLI